ncbi:hypothetical protein F2P56_020561, partial [Juglans regia]
LRAEGNLVVSPTIACKCAGLVIFRVTVSIGTTFLKKSGIVCGFAASRIATILIGLEYSAWIVASTGSSQLIGALPVDICSTSYPTGAPIRGGTKFYGNIKPIHKRDIKEIQIVKLI